MIAALLLLVVLQASPGSQVLESEPLGAHEGPVQDLFFADGGKSLVTSTRAGMVRVWNVRSGKLAGEYRHEDALDQVVPSNEGKSIVFVSKGTFGVLDGKDAKFEGSMAHPPAVLHAVVFVPKWRWLFAGQDQGILRRFASGNIAEPGDTLGIQLGTVVALAASSEGEWVAAGDSKGAILLVDPVKLDARAALDGHTARITALVFDRKGETLYSSSSDHTLRVWDVETHVEKEVLEGHEAPVLSLDLDAKGSRLASGDETGVVLLHETKSRQRILRFETGAGPVTSLAFDPKGKRLATPGPGNTVALWDVAEVR